MQKLNGLWRKEDPTFHPDGSLEKGGMFEGQRKWWNSKSYMKALVGGYGSGKTMISAKRAISVSLANAPSPYLYVSPSYKLGKRTIIPHLKNLLNGKGIPFKHNKADNEFKLNYRGREAIIWTASGDDPDALKGPNIGAANIDEPFLQDRGVFEQIMARVRDPIARIREITMTGTPEELNWGYEICEGAEAKKFDLEVIHASSRENKALPEQYIESLLSGFDEETIQAYVDGKFILQSKGAIYKNYSDENLTEREFKPGPILWTHDFNFLPMSSAIIQREGNGCYVVDEIILDHADAQDSAYEFIERYKGFTQCPVVLYGDPSGRTGEKHGKVSEYLAIQDILKSAGFRVTMKVQRSTKSIRDGQNSLKGKIKNSKGVRSFFINKAKAPTCHRAMQTVKAKEGSSFIEDERNTSQHVGTALRYFAHTEFPVESVKGTVRIR